MPGKGSDYTECCINLIETKIMSDLDEIIKN